MHQQTYSSSNSCTFAGKPLGVPEYIASQLPRTASQDQTSLLSSMFQGF